MYIAMGIVTLAAFVSLLFDDIRICWRYPTLANYAWASLEIIGALLGLIFITLGLLQQ